MTERVPPTIAQHTGMAQKYTAARHSLALPIATPYFSVMNIILSKHPFQFSSFTPE
jgi:hypothetical protein